MQRTRGFAAPYVASEAVVALPLVAEWLGGGCRVVEDADSVVPAHRKLRDGRGTRGFVEDDGEGERRRPID